MKITICTSGRFHVADLARELLALEHDVTFHSIVPPRSLEAFRIPREHQVCHLAAVAPLVALRRLRHVPEGIERGADRALQRILDARFARIRDPGDVLIGMSGLCVETLRAAKKRGATVLVERGSRHILSQKRILDALDPVGPSLVSDWTVERELAGYETADTIVVASRHVIESFREEDVPDERLFRNPYGVDLEGFGPTKLDALAWDVIMVGRWGRRKGCDVLAEVVLERMKCSLLHVGPVDELPLPSHPRFRHVNPVPQAELPNWYARARVFAMPSREDGFGMVFSQALACGLPIVGSTRSGSRDLAELLELGSPVVQAVPPDDKEELARAIAAALELPMPEGERDLLGGKAESLSWREYAARYARFLSTL